MADKDGLDEFARLVWDSRLQGIPLPDIDLKRDITPQELANIKQRVAFVQILNPQPWQDYEGIQFVRASSRWLILNYGNAMATSPGEMLFHHGQYDQKKDGSLERVPSGTGTIIAQIINTATDMVQLAANKLSWPSIHIVDGYPLMKWGIWKAAKDLDIPIIGYVPSVEEERKHERLKANCSQTLVIHPEPGGIKP